MNRNLTNTIRFFMDECLPPIIRDHRYFMFPFYYLAYRGKNISQIMNYKKLVYQFTKEEYLEFYRNLDSISKHRKTDLNQESLHFILQKIVLDQGKVIDIGCGQGHLLEQIKHQKASLELYGLDLAGAPSTQEHVSKKLYHYVPGSIEDIPFESQSFDIVLCSHVLEHVINLNRAIKELKRIAKKFLIIVVPRQRYYYYTLDEHLHFFESAAKLERILTQDDECNWKQYQCYDLNSDLVFYGEITTTPS